MAFVKLVFFYNQDKRGFSETFWLPDQTPKAAADGLPNTLLANAVAFRSPSTLLYAVRASNEGPPRLSYLRLLEGRFKGTDQEVVGDESDVTSTTAVLKLSAANGVTRRVFLRGLPDNYVVRDDFGNDLPPAAFNNARAKYVSSMKAAGLSIRYQIRPPVAGLTFAVVLNLISNAANPAFTDIDSLPTVGFVPIIGAQITFAGIDPRLRDFPRTARIINTSVIGLVNRLTIQYRMPAGGIIVPAKMKMLNVVYLLAAIEEGVFERFSEHKTGRPFGQLPGRSRAAARV